MGKVDEESEMDKRAKDFSSLQVLCDSIVLSGRKIDLRLDDWFANESRSRAFFFRVLLLWQGKRNTLLYRLRR